MTEVKKLDVRFQPDQDGDNLTINCILEASVDGVAQIYETNIEIATDAMSRKFMDLYDLCNWQFKNWWMQKLEELRQG